MRKISKFVIASMLTASIPVLAVDEFIMSSPGSTLRFQTQSGTEVAITCDPRTQDGRTMTDLEAEIRQLTERLSANRSQPRSTNNDYDSYDYHC